MQSGFGRGRTHPDCSLEFSQVMGRAAILRCEKGTVCRRLVAIALVGPRDRGTSKAVVSRGISRRLRHAYCGHEGAVAASGGERKRVRSK